MPIIQKLGRLYAVTDDRYLPPQRLTMLVKKACEGGVDMIQLRLKNKDLIPFCFERVKKITEKYKILLIINDFPELVKELNADGVHVGRNDPPPEKTRKIIGGKILGISAYDSIQYALKFENIFDYVSFSSPFPSATKERKPTPFKVIKEAVIRIKKPIYVIGGICEKNIKSIMEIGVYGVAVSSYIFNAEDPEKRARILKKIIDEIS